jgi:CDP-diacylglycerol pyrophosphatase
MRIRLVGHSGEPLMNVGTDGPWWEFVKELESCGHKIVSSGYGANVDVLIANSHSKDAIRECKKNTEVWYENVQFLDIRDINMCGFAKSFIHGLAMPKYEVTGIEDIRRPEEIWQFAWDTSKKIIEPDLIALAVNPKSRRSQNQLHVHLVRIDPKVQNKFNTYSYAYVKNLEHVWETADKLAAKNSLIDYGILVTQATSNQFIVLITPNSPEGEFTIWNCN